MSECGKNKRYTRVFAFLVFTAIMSMHFISFPLNSGATSEQCVGGMITAGIINMDMSQTKFGMNVLSCDGIVYNGGGADPWEQGRGIRTLIWNSRNYQGRNVEIASTRKQQIGIQGWFMYYLSRIFRGIRISSKFYYYTFRSINAFMLAIILTAISFQLKRAYDYIFAASFYCVCLASSWITIFAPNIYWWTFTWFIPMLAGLMCMNNPGKRWYIYPLVFLGTALKSMCGYEYITCVMMCSIVFTLSECISCWKVNRKRSVLMFRTTIGIGISALAGFVAVILLHAYLRGDGSIMNGLNEIYRADVLRRTFGRDMSLSISNDAARQSSVFFVLAKYLFRPEDWGAFSLLVLSSAQLINSRFRHNLPVKRDAVLLAVSFWSSISWFVLGKNHSYMHTHMNHILWFMPFIPTAVYVFLKQRIAVMLPEATKRRAILDSAYTFAKKMFLLS